MRSDPPMRDAVLWVISFGIVIFLAIVFACVVAQAGGPVEPPSRVRVPEAIMRKPVIPEISTPEAVQQLPVLEQEAWIELIQLINEQNANIARDAATRNQAAWFDLVGQINDKNMFTFEAIREWSFQTGLDYLHNIGTDSTTVRMPKGYRDSISYAAFVQLTYENPYNHTQFPTGVVAVQWADSFSVRAFGNDTCTFRWFTIGIRP